MWAQLRFCHLINSGQVVSRHQMTSKWIRDHQATFSWELLRFLSYTVKSPYILKCIPSIIWNLGLPKLFVIVCLPHVLSSLTIIICLFLRSPKVREVLLQRKASGPYNPSFPFTRDAVLLPSAVPLLPEQHTCAFVVAFPHHSQPSDFQTVLFSCWLDHIPWIIYFSKTFFPRQRPPPWREQGHKDWGYLVLNPAFSPTSVTGQSV